jgi:hypothetical protein
MLDVALRMRALSLYRALMRSVRTWPGPLNEKQYIYEESHTLFRRNQHLTDPAAISQKVNPPPELFESSPVLGQGVRHSSFSP